MTEERQNQLCHLDLKTKPIRVGNAIQGRHHGVSHVNGNGSKGLDRCRGQGATLILGYIPRNGAHTVKEAGGL